MNIESMFARVNKRRHDDARRFESLDNDLCMLCNAYGADKRSLFISCLYQINEAVPEAIDLFDTEFKDRGWFVRICKECRGKLLEHLRDWRNECVERQSIPKDHDGGDLWDEEATIAVRIAGRTVWMTEEQYNGWKDKE